MYFLWSTQIRKICFINKKTIEESNFDKHVLINHTKLINSCKIYDSKLA